MANTKNAQSAQENETSMVEQFGNVANLPSETLNREALFDTAQFAEESAWDTVSGDYFKFKEGETVLLVLNGVSQMESSLEENRGEMVDVAELEDKHGNKFINADVVMVSTAKKLVERSLTPCLIRVFYDGKRGTGRKQYANLIISRFDTRK